MNFHSGQEYIRRGLSLAPRLRRACACRTHTHRVRCRGFPPAIHTACYTKRCLLITSAPRRRTLQLEPRLVERKGLCAAVRRHRHCMSG